MQTEQTKARTNNMQKFGIDISKWQGSFDFDKAVSEGAEFVIIKGGGGDDGLYIDPKFERNYKEAKKAGLDVGCYFFSRATDTDTAKKEAQYFYKKILKGKQFELPVYMDVEQQDMLNLGREQLTDVIEAFCEELEFLGYWVGIYSTPYVFLQQTNDEKLQVYAHWIAQWSRECTYPYTNVLGVWQFGGDVNYIKDNKVAGVICDQDYMYIDYPTLIKERGLNGFEKKFSSELVSKSMEEIAKEIIEGKWSNGEERKIRLKKAGYDYAIVQRLVNEMLQNRKLEVGDLVTLTDDAVVYGTSKKFAKWAYKSKFYVRSVAEDRIIISLFEEGAVTGAVHVNHLREASSK